MSSTHTTLTREEVLKIARLARLELTEQEVEFYRIRLGRVLEYMRELGELETPKDAFVRHVPKDAVAFREDKPVPSGNHQMLMGNAPQVEDGCFVLPVILEPQE